MKLHGVCIDDVDDSSSCGLETDGDDVGEITMDDGICDETVVDAKFRNIANIESAEDTFKRSRLLQLRISISGSINSELESLP